MQKRTLSAASFFAVMLLVGAGCGPQVNTNYQADVNTRPPEGLNVPVNSGMNGNVNAGVNGNVNASAGGSMDMRIAGNAIIIGAQRPGNSLTFELIENDAAAFVVINEGQDGKGERMGVTPLLTAGANMNVKVTLSRTTMDGEMLYASAWADNGDGVLTDADQPLMSGTGEPLYTVIEIDAEASDDPLLPRI